MRPAGHKENRVYFGMEGAPPHHDHVSIVASLCADPAFARVAVVLTGKRSDKPEYCAPRHRSALAGSAFVHIARTYPETFLLDERDVGKANTPTRTLIEQEERRYPDARIWWAVGSDIVMPHPEWGGVSAMERHWYRGSELYREKNFIVIPRVGFSLSQHESLPKNFCIKEIALQGITSSDIRGRIRSRMPWQHLVPIEEAVYITKHALFQ